MLLSRKHRFAFIHNPKAGGTAIRTALAPYAEEPNRYWHQKFLPAMHRVVDYAHMDEAERQADGVDLTQFDYVFMVVRDPISRFLSGFAEHCRQHYRNVEVNEFIRTELTYGNVTCDWKYVHMRPQFQFASSNVKLFQHETLGEDWMHISLNTAGEIVRLTASRVDPGNKPNLKSLTNESYARLVKVYAKDYEWLKRFYNPPVTMLNSGEHADNMDFIHNPVLRPYLLTNRLRPGELKGLENLMKEERERTNNLHSDLR